MYEVVTTCVPRKDDDSAGVKREVVDVLCLLLYSPNLPGVGREWPCLRVPESSAANCRLRGRKEGWQGQGGPGVQSGFLWACDQGSGQPYSTQSKAACGS